MNQQLFTSPLQDSRHWEGSLFLGKTKTKEETGVKSHTHTGHRVLVQLQAEQFEVGSDHRGHCLLFAASNEGKLVIHRKCLLLLVLGEATKKAWQPARGPGPGLTEDSNFNRAARPYLHLSTTGTLTE